MTELSAWLALPAAFAVSFAWRALGVAVSGRIEPNSPLFAWVQCVAYAMLAGLVARMLIFPGGTLADTEIGHRLGAIAFALILFFVVRRNMFVALIGGVGAFVGFNVLLG